MPHQRPRPLMERQMERLRPATNAIMTAGQWPPAFGTAQLVSTQSGPGAAAVRRGRHARSAPGGGRSERVHPSRRSGEDVVLDVGRLGGEGSSPGGDQWWKLGPDLLDREVAAPHAPVRAEQLEA